MALQWGLGIEHEVALFGPMQLMSKQKVMKLFLREDTFNSLGWNAAFLTKQIQVLAKRAQLPVLPRLNDIDWLLQVMQSAVDEHSKSDYSSKSKDTRNKECKPEDTRVWAKRLTSLLDEGRVTKKELQFMLKRVTVDHSNLGPLPEIVSLDFKNATLQSIVREVRNTEDILQNVLSPMLEFKVQPCMLGVWPLVLMDRPLFEECAKGKPWIAPDYTGSYHINITLPVRKRSQFMARHALAALMLQWCEPLLIASVGQPDPFALLDDWQATEGSFRMSTNEFSALGTQNVSSATQLKSPALKDRRANNPVLPDPWSPVGTQWLKRMRTAAAQRYQPPPYLNVVRSEQSAYTRMHTIGTDFRRAQKPPFGFEFRVLDNMTLDVLQDVVHVLLLLCDHSAAVFDMEHRRNHKGALEDAVPDPRGNMEWNALTREVFLEGHNAVVPQSQRVALAQALHLPIVVLSKSTAQELFQQLVSWLWKTYGRGKGVYTMHMCPGMHKPRIPNLNKAAFAQFARAWGVTQETHPVDFEDASEV